MGRAINGTIYLLHFSEKYRHAGHYLGWADDLAARLAQHANGQGARLTSVIAAAGLSFECVRTWAGTRRDERKLKERRCAPLLCPVCHEERAARRREQARAGYHRRKAQAARAGLVEPDLADGAGRFDEDELPF